MLTFGEGERFPDRGDGARLRRIPDQGEMITAPPTWIQAPSRKQ